MCGAQEGRRRHAEGAKGSFVHSPAAATKSVIVRSLAANHWRLRSGSTVRATHSSSSSSPRTCSTPNQLRPTSAAANLRTPPTRAHFGLYPAATKNKPEARHPWGTESMLARCYIIISAPACHNSLCLQSKSTAQQGTHPAGAPQAHKAEHPGLRGSPQRQRRQRGPPFDGPSRRALLM